MFLHEEYIVRHQLDVLPILYTETINVFFKSGTNQWLVLFGRWQDGIDHPGFYRFRFASPVHDGYLEDDWYADLPGFIGRTVQWDQYELSLLNWIASLRGLYDAGFRAIETSEVLVAWEIFLYIHDQWFVNHIEDSKFFDDIEQSTNSAIVESERLSAYNRCTSRLSRHRFLLSHFLDRMLPLTRPYSVWLAKLANSYF